MVRFNILDTMKHRFEDHSIFHVDIIDHVVDGHIYDFHPLHCIKYSSVSEISEFAWIDILDSNSEYDMDNVESAEFDSLGVVPIDFDVIQSDCTNHVAGNTYASDCYAEVQVMEPISSSPLVPDIQLASSTLVLKPLLDNFKYVYLEEEKLPAIISTSLTIEQEQRLLEVLKKHKKAIGWILADILGITHPCACT